MELFKKQPLLLGLLIVLLLIGFIISPIIDWQNDSLEEIRGLQKKQQKTQFALQREADNRTLLQSIQRQQTQFSDLFFKGGDEAKFKLERQQWLEELVTKHNFKATNIGWTNSSSVPNTSIIKHNLQVRIEGHLSKLPAFQSDLESTRQWIELDGFSVSIKRQIKHNLGQATVTLQLNLFQLPISREEGIDE
jgi:hypothetical protein